MPQQLGKSTCQLDRHQTARRDLQDRSGARRIGVLVRHAMVTKAGGRVRRVQRHAPDRRRQRKQRLPADGRLPAERQRQDRVRDTEEYRSAGTLAFRPGGNTAPECHPLARRACCPEEER
ncbi:hypothetical protein ACFPM0_24575 [Pseudonocardia sulfidoxydans]|uniref:hypothetical protein n=1 Tax=Pseudonocardia sulfidoxydans TaxID=54011 RepID=UPI003606B0C4